MLLRYNGQQVVGISTVAKVLAVLIGAVAWWVTTQNTFTNYLDKNYVQHEELISQHRLQLPVLRQICRNTATTELSGSLCDKAY